MYETLKNRMSELTAQWFAGLISFAEFTHEVSRIQMHLEALHAERDLRHAQAETDRRLAEIEQLNQEEQMQQSDRRLEQ